MLFYLQVYQVQDILEDALRQWDTYHHLVGKVNTELTNTEYALNRFNLATGNIELFAGQLSEVKVSKAQVQKWLNFCLISVLSLKPEYWQKFVRNYEKNMI